MTDITPQKYIAAITDDARRADCQAIMTMMGELSGCAPKMWGTAIVGFGEYHYKYDSGREGDYFRLGFSNRAKQISIYIMPGYEDFDEELSRLGKHKMGKACLFIKSLSDVDETVLREIMAKGLSIMQEKYPV